MNESISYQENKELIEMEHKLKIIELTYARETNRLLIEDQKSLHRLKRADERRKATGQFADEFEQRGGY